MIPIDFSEYAYSSFDKSLLYWDRHNKGHFYSNGHVVRGRSNRGLVMTEQFGSVTILKGIRSLSTGHNWKSRCSDSLFDGICVDNGTQTSVRGKTKSEEYCKTVSIPLVLRPSLMKFKFGNTQSLGIMKFRFPCPHGGSIDVEMDFIDLDIPLLLGLRELRTQRLLVDFLSNTLSCKHQGWSTRLCEKYGHLYWDLLSMESFYSTADIERLHRHFFHPSTKKLYDLLKRSELGKTTENLRSIIDSVSKACVKCKKFSARPFHFRASFWDESVVYNHELVLDLMWLNGSPVLHVVDTHTSFQNAAFVVDKSPEEFWRSFKKCWTTVYLGLPNVLRVDQEASFHNAKFMALCNIHGVTLQSSEVESHNSIDKGERFHASLGTVYQLLLENNPNLSKELKL